MPQFEWPRNVCHIIELHGGASERLSLGYCTVYIGIRLPTFRRGLMLSFSLWSNKPSERYNQHVPSKRRIFTVKLFHGFGSSGRLYYV